MLSIGVTNRRSTSIGNSVDYTNEYLARFTGGGSPTHWQPGATSSLHIVGHALHGSSASPRRTQSHNPPPDGEAFSAEYGLSRSAIS